MGKFYNIGITDPAVTDKINILNNFFNSLDGVSSEVTTYTYSGSQFLAVDITIENTEIELIYGLLDAQYSGAVCKVTNGAEVLINDAYTSNPWGRNPDVVASAYIDEQCTILFIYRYAADFQAGPLGVELVYTKDKSDTNLVGYGTLTTGTLINLMDIASLTFENADNHSGIKYTYTNMFPYVATAGTIDFTNEAFFVNNNTRHFTSDFLKECSTVPLASTQSLSDGNYIALGVHCLAPLDEEE